MRGLISNPLIVMCMQILNWDFSHPFKCPLTDRSWYIMEDYMRFIDCYFQLLFAAPASHPLLDPDIKRAFGHLRRFVRSHMQVHGEETESARLTRITKAREELLDFAKIAYEVRRQHYVRVIMRDVDNSA